MGAGLTIGATVLQESGQRVASARKARSACLERLERIQLAVNSWRARAKEGLDPESTEIISLGSTPPLDEINPQKVANDEVR